MKVWLLEWWRVRWTEWGLFFPGPLETSYIRIYSNRDSYVPVFRPTLVFLAAFLSVLLNRFHSVMACWMIGDCVFLYAAIKAVLVTSESTTAG